MTTAAELLALQEIDISLDRARARLSEIEASLVETEELVEARGVVEEKQAVVDDLRRKQKDQELSVDEARTKTSDIEKRLYSESTRNPKELVDLQADLSSLQTQVRRREDDLLAVLVELEDAEAQLQAARSAYSDIESRFSADQQSLLAEKAELEPVVERQQAERDAMAQETDRSQLGLYDLLRQRKAGQAAALVERGMCQGCRITLPVSILQRARAGTGLVQCVSCERILVVS